MKCMRNKKRSKERNTKKCRENLEICMKTINKQRKTLRNGNGKSLPHMTKQYMMNSWRIDIRKHSINMPTHKINNMMINIAVSLTTKAIRKMILVLNPISIKNNPLKTNLDKDMAINTVHLITKATITKWVLNTTQKCLLSWLTDLIALK